VPKPEESPSAVVVSGGKQYRVTAGDRVLVDRLKAEPGSSVKLGRVLLLRDGDEVSIGNPGVDGAEVEAKVIAHRRGPRIETLRYKSKKRVRVHRGGRADLTAVEILTVGHPAKAKPKHEEAEPEESEKAAPKRAARKPKAAKAAAKSTKEDK
jgi:large subunit ribosomal protein L21